MALGASRRLHSFLFPWDPSWARNKHPDLLICASQARGARRGWMSSPRRSAPWACTGRGFQHLLPGLPAVTGNCAGHALTCLGPGGFAETLTPGSVWLLQKQTSLGIACLSRLELWWWAVGCTAQSGPLTGVCPPPSIPFSPLTSPFFLASLCILAGVAYPLFF